MSKKNRRARKRIASKKYIFPKSFFQRRIEERGEKTEKKTFSNGKHISFSNSYHMSNFFEILTNILTNLKQPDITSLDNESDKRCKNNQLRKRRAV